MNNAASIQAMRAWCLENYELGADTMVECWDTDDYQRLIEDDHRGDTAAAWETLKRLASIYQDRQADARRSAF
jgi:hypothetical protein